eukprot:TRINITY_DN3422_c2_g1_i2.p1 TRINITY_DN3422_c2_g1~~TRINITY_DN3422_c2_g1_i2.p1  ORF type:complete len:295 (-),score=92.01 TRINITY_DN3422_c2_g1_i2:352-1236(-)
MKVDLTGTDPSFHLSDEAKYMLYFVVFQFIIYVGLTIEIMVTAMDRNDTRQVYTSTLIIISAVIFTYFAFDGVRKENVYEHFCFLLMTLFIGFYIIYTYFAYDKKETDIVYTIRLGAVALFEPINLVLGWKIYNNFGWRVYKEIGANVKFHDMFREYQIFFALLKIDWAIAILLVLMSAFFLFNMEDWELYADIVACVVMLLWGGMGWRGVQSEESGFMYVFSAMWVVYPIYIIWKIQEFFFAPNLYPTVWKPPFIVFGGVAIAVHLNLLMHAVKCWRNFGKGLKEKVFDRENQ